MITPIGPIFTIRVPPPQPGTDLRYCTLCQATTLHQHTCCVDEHGRDFETIVCLPCLTNLHRLINHEDN